MSERALTVDDVWHLSDDPTDLDHAAATLRARAAELEAASALVRRGQHALGQLLDWIEVPMTWHPGRLTFFPRDGHDLAAITAAQEAAAEIHAAVSRAMTSAVSSGRA
jgi:hypothetical protein